MTAIGLFILLVVFTCGWIDGFVLLPEWLAQIMGIAAVVGLVMFLYGLFTWIWMVMP